MKRYNDNANNTEEKPKRKTDGKDRTTSRDHNPKENMIHLVHTQGHKGHYENKH